MSDKAEWAYRTISEVSEELDVPPHVLRFWETKFTQLKPMKRSGSRRYYKASDLELLVRIRDLLYRDGFTIKGAQKALKDKKLTDSAAKAAETGNAPAKGNGADTAPSSASEALQSGGRSAQNVADAIATLKRLEARIDKLLSHS